jgi:predicted amidophosphoribosyltransferase
MSGSFKCPKCGATTWGQLKCCPQCGQSLNITCPDCGKSWRYIYAGEYKCCPNCGAKMSKEGRVKNDR